MRKLIIAVAAIAGLLGLATANASAHERWFNVVNNSNETIVGVHATNIDVDSWGRDLLGSTVIRAGRRLVVEPVRHFGYCRFDVKIDFADGSSQEISDVNLCEATAVVTYGQVRNGYRHNVIY